ncbi:chemotaxis protein CheB [Pseudoduganella namucuonensis]|uniref:protein-glutamate O-methyltransferase n=1 Tax=Pseudoduganella namucuonensis TaxID=1035707 RepID=A0A1I7JMH2_9BURK|nr:chemotaxis protein CheB [Pseudoduganella namucuonensis]SFU86330.1 two-component system, chemotaxis family, CheB/CheR fusion protein [Pseudoduganella namucuonensis]
MSKRDNVPTPPPDASATGPLIPEYLEPPVPAVPVVGIGASAGGLEPICGLLAAIPAGSGMAYVVVQHLDPRHPGMLPPLLQRVTAMPVREAMHGMRVEADCVYVIPAGGELGFERGALTVCAPAPRPPGAPHLAIDAFFAALALERGELAAGVLLSGAGMDGTCGMRAIQDAGGLTLVQRPSTAQFEPMPQNAIDAGVADIVELPARMAQRIVDWHRGRRPLRLLRGTGMARHSALGELLMLLQDHTGNDFSDYKLNTVMRRIERRMNLHQFRTLVEYVALLRDNPGEVDLLFKEMLIGVTSFFRDEAVWDELRTLVLPRLLAAHPDGADFKAWVPACSTGEEAYTLAIVFNEALAELRPAARYTLQIFATDLDPDAIDRARHGCFPLGLAQALPEARLQRSFTVEDQGYRIRKELRNMIIFAEQNVISDPPFTKLDLLCCRNLLIYFSARLQQQLIPLFHYALKPDGCLVLGNADTPGQCSDLFAPVAGGSRIFRRLEGGQRLPLKHFSNRVALSATPQPYEARAASMSGNLQSQVEQQLLKTHTPAAVLLNRDGDILYIHGRTGAYLEPAAGKANWNIHAMVREPLRYALEDLLRRAGEGEGAVGQGGIALQDGHGAARLVNLVVEPLGGEQGQEMLLVTFASAPAPARRRREPVTPRVAELERQLEQARLEVRTVRDEMQTSREELRSANEELQSTNEELQSANAELTMSKEEMQSLNEELYTVNAELQSKVDDLSLVNSDMRNLLNSTDIATIFLDSALHIRRFTTPATQIYKLIASDVQRPLSDIANDLDYPELERDAQEVLRTLVFSEKQVAARDGRWFTARIMPYRTADNVIEGVVLTFLNITEAKRLETQLRLLSGRVRDAGGGQ